MEKRTGTSIAQKAFIAIGIGLLFTSDILANIKLPQIFSNNMVLQQGIELQVWGWADPNEAVDVSIGDNTAKTVANAKGEWKVKLAPEKAGGPVELVISGKNTIALKDVLIGEVWICSGQSNMEMGLVVVKNAKQEVAQANYPQIRLFKVKQAASGIPLRDFLTDDDGLQTWRVCNSKNVSEGGWGGFSAAAYFFGRELHNKLNVPVGLINSSWGGTAIKPWTPPVGFAMVKQFENDVKEIELRNREYVDAEAVALAKLATWLKDANEAIARGGMLSAPEWPVHALARPVTATGLYNAMINPVVPFAIRGAIWYQGEANCGERMMYFHSMEALVGGWRTAWGQGDFPFYYVQLAPYRYNRSEELPWSWQAQLTSLSIPNTGMIVTTDLVDNVDDIHPVNKQEVGRRLALWALAKTYGRNDIVYSGPLYRGMKVENDMIRIYFDHVAGGLTTRDGKEPNCFEIASADLKFVRADARIDANTIVVSNQAIKAPAAVRFGWNELAMPNLMNKEGLPTSPFTTEAK